MLRRTLTTALAALLLAAAPIVAQTQQDYIGGAAAIVLANEHLDAPPSSYDLDATALDVDVRSGLIAFDYDGPGVESCRAIAAAGLVFAVQRDLGGRWDVTVDCGRGGWVEAVADLGSRPYRFRVSHLRGGREIFSAAWSGR